MTIAGPPADLPWNRLEQIERLRERIWLHLSRTAEVVDEVRPDAAALLQLGEVDLRHLARLHFVLSAEVDELLADLPALVRRLATTTAAEEEWSRQRLRGPVHWSRTLAARSVTGDPYLYVTTPAERAYQTPENELLVHVLDAIVAVGRETRLVGARSGVGREIASRVDRADSWRRRRSLAGVERRPVTPRSTSRVRAGRNRTRYGAALRAHEALQRLVVHLDRDEIRRVVERRAFAAATDAVLFEVACTFDVVDALAALGWRLSRLRLFGTPRGLRLRGRRGDERLTLWYQHTPPQLANASAYAAVLAAHDLAVDWAGRRPDIVIRLESPPSETRWILVEAKLGTRRGVRESARAALADLLSYGREFADVLDPHAQPYGLGIAWGAGLAPRATAEVLLTTPDQLRPALALLLDHRQA